MQIELMALYRPRMWHDILCQWGTEHHKAQWPRSDVTLPGHWASQRSWNKVPGTSGAFLWPTETIERPGLELPEVLVHLWGWLLFWKQQRLCAVSSDVWSHLWNQVSIRQVKLSLLSSLDCTSWYRHRNFKKRMEMSCKNTLLLKS